MQVSLTKFKTYGPDIGKGVGSETIMIYLTTSMCCAVLCIYQVLSRSYVLVFVLLICSFCFVGLLADVICFHLITTPIILLFYIFD